MKNRIKNLNISKSNYTSVLSDTVRLHVMSVYIVLLFSEIFLTVITNNHYCYSSWCIAEAV